MRQHHHRGAAHDVRWDFREGGKTLSTGAAPPNHRCVADSAARRIWWLCGTAPLKWSTPRLVLRRADAGVACFYLPFDLSAVDPQTPRFLHVARSLAGMETRLSLAHQTDSGETRIEANGHYDGAIHRTHRCSTDDDLDRFVLHRIANRVFIGTTRTPGPTCFRTTCFSPDFSDHRFAS